MKKRLRKKLYKGEFQELGFSLRLRIRPGLDETAQERIFDAFLLEAVEARRLAFGGGGQEGAWDGFVTRTGRGSASEEDRAALTHWLDDRPEVEDYAIGPLIDAWYAA